MQLRLCYCWWRDSLHTMTDIQVSKLPKGKALMRHTNVPSSETSVLVMTRDESMVGSLFLKRTRRDQAPNAAREERAIVRMTADGDWQIRKADTDLKDNVEKDVTEKIKPSNFKKRPRGFFCHHHFHTHACTPRIWFFILGIYLAAFKSTSNTCDAC